MQKLHKSPWVRLNLGVTVTDAQGTHEAARLVNLSPDGAQLHAPQAGREAEVNMLEYGIAFRNITTSDAL